MKLRPVLKEYLWGGTRLKEDFEMETELPKVAEAWTLACHKDGKNIIENGEFSGKTLDEILRENDFSGTNALNFSYFPVLIKLIDAKDNLSIQVHPDDEYAERVEHEFGKTEIWYVLDCTDDAQLIYGFKKEIGSEEFRQAIENNTLTDVLNSVKVNKGDLFFIEAGTVHAIGKGTLIAEIQQNSNSTYRVYDYGRVGADGKQRELHVQKAVDISVTAPPKHGTKPQGNPIEKEGFTETLLTACPLFTVRKYDVRTQALLTATEKSFKNILVTDGCGTIDAMPFKKGDSFFVPAGFGNFTVSGNAQLIVTNI